MTAISSMVVIAIRAVNVIGCNNDIRIHKRIITNKYQFILLLNFKQCLLSYLKFKFKLTATIT